MGKLEPLTAEEQQLAERYFYMVDKFLQRKRLDPSEYYDIAIFGYLAAIQRGFRNPNPPETPNLCGLIEVCMERAVLMEWRNQYRNKRKVDRESLSLDCTPVQTDNGELSLCDVIADVRQNTEVQVEARDLTGRVLAVATPREREVIDLVQFGCGNREIAQMLGIAVNTVNRILCNFRVKAKAVRDDREVMRCPQWARDKEKVRARNRAYDQNHREECNLWKREYRAVHLEEVREKERAYHAAHKDEINARRRAKRAAKRAEKLRPAAPDDEAAAAVERENA